MDTLAELIGDIIFHNLDRIGAAVKWLWYRGKRKYSELLEESWNVRIGLLLFILFIILVVKLV